jgi:hypothetical protein
MFTRLNSAFLQQADLRAANLFQADLTGARLAEVRLSNASLWNANCAQSTFGGVDLDHALFFSTNLTEATFDHSDLSSVTFEPVSLPTIRGFATSSQLEELTYSQNPDALAQLLKAFEDGGFTKQEREVTYALRHTQQTFKEREAARAAYLCPGLRWFISAGETRELERYYGSDFAKRAVCSYRNALQNGMAYGFDRVMFDWSCRYGMEPNRCLDLLLWGWLASARSGIYRVRNHRSKQKETQVKTRVGFHRVHFSGSWRLLRWPYSFMRSECRLLRVAAFFSLMNAFNIRFREIDFGRWLRLFTIREYDLKAEGWARPVAAFQALFSLYMIALWVLAFFGRPFSH